MASVEKEHCGICEKPPDHYCINCDELLCQKCHEFIHQNHKKSHNLVTFEFFNKYSPRELKPCNEHENEKNRNFCESCQVLFCSLCSEKHQNHNFKTLNSKFFNYEFISKKNKTFISNQLEHVENILNEIPNHYSNLLIELEKSLKNFEQEKLEKLKEHKSYLECLLEDENTVIKPENINSVRMNFEDSFQKTLSSMKNSLKKSNFEIEYGIPSILLEQFDLQYMNRKNDYSKTLVFTNQALEIYPLNISILVLKAECLSKLKKIEESKKILNFVTKYLKPYSDMDEFSIGEAFLLLKNNEMAVKYYQKSSESGNNYALNKLGSIYYTGDSDLDIKVNRKLAVKYFQKSADEGFTISEYNIGYCYYMGHVFEKDRNIACDWFEKSAKKGYSIAQNKLGSCYLSGVGVEESYVKAKEWFKLAADNGYQDAIQSINFMDESEIKDVEVKEIPSPKSPLSQTEKKKFSVKDIKNWRNSISVFKSQSFYKNQEKDQKFVVPPDSPLVQKSKKRGSFFNSIRKDISKSEPNDVSKQ
eukprot:gene2231-2405_t